MATECIPQVTFDFYDNLKPVVARFDQAQASTDGGLVLLKALDDRFRLTEQLAGCLADRRDPDKIRHPIRDLLRQWIFGLACGYEDGDDAARLADDPLHKLAVGRDPVTGSVSFPPLFGQVFPENKLMDFCRIFSFRSGFPCPFFGFRLKAAHNFVPESVLRGDLPPVHTGVAVSFHPKCTSAGVRRPRLWCRRSVL